MDANINAPTIEIQIPNKEFQALVKKLTGWGLTTNKAIGEIAREYKVLSNRVLAEYPEWSGSWLELIDKYELEMQEDLLVGKRKPQDWPVSDIVETIEDFPRDLT